MAFVIFRHILPCQNARTVLVVAIANYPSIYKRPISIKPYSRPAPSWPRTVYTTPPSSPPPPLSTLALRKITRRRTRARHLREIHNRIITQHFRLRHDIEMVLEPILVRATGVRAPLRIAVIRAQVRDHHDDRLPRGAARAAARAGCVAGRCQLVAFPAAGTAPGETAGVVEGLRGGGGVDA